MFWQRWGAALDQLPAGVSLPLGLGLGIFAGGLLLLAPSAVGVLGFLVLLAAAGVIAWSGEPVEALPAPSPRLRPVLTEKPEKGLLPIVELVAIPDGRFLIGSHREENGRFDNEEPVHEVEISAFLCMKTLVTRRLYAAVAGSDPGWPKGDSDDRPINNVSWFDAVDFCNRLSERKGLVPCYERTGGEVKWHHEAGGYRLPTEAEWEYACRAGTYSRWSFGDDEEQLADHAWYGGNAGGEPQSVGRKKPNPWGLFDMHGNVWERCWNGFGTYEAMFEQDPAGPLYATHRALRGGSFADAARFLRSAVRFWIRPEGRNGYIGFRCVRGPAASLEVSEASAAHQAFPPALSPGCASPDF
jgi:formylglycine-generating enzyme required for sulfatase activity